MSTKRVTCALVIHEGRVLIARRKEGQSNAGLWEFPGGKVEAGETDEACLAREMQEEFGIIGLTGTHVCTSRYAYAFGEIELCAYHFLWLRGEYQMRVHDEIRFVTAQELLTAQLSPADVPIAQAVIPLLQSPADSSVTYQPAAQEDIAPLYTLCSALIRAYEDPALDIDRILHWVQRKLIKSINEYTCIYIGGEKAGYYHFAPAEGKMELDDLYIFPAFQRRGIGTQVVKRCLESTHLPVFLYAFIANEGAVRLYERMGFIVREVVGGTRYIMEANGKA